MTQPDKKPARPRTPKQIEASRNNGAKSKGPVTEVGKEKSSANSYDHGLYSKKLYVLRIEKSEEYERTIQMFRAEWRPTGPTEETLVRSLALETISLDRFRMMQSEALNSMTDRAPAGMFVGEVTDPERQYGGMEEYTLNGRLPNFLAIDRAIARADRTFRASLTSILHLRRARKDMKIDPFEPPPSRFDGLRPTPPGEPSESLERRIAEARKQENEQTNPAPGQIIPIQQLPAPQTQRTYGPRVISSLRPSLSRPVYAPPPPFKPAPKEIKPRR